MLLGYPILSLEKYHFKPFAHFLIGLFGFLLMLSYRSSLYVLDITSLLDMSFADFFSRSVGEHFVGGVRCCAKALYFGVVLIAIFCVCSGAKFLADVPPRRCSVGTNPIQHCHQESVTDLLGTRVLKI